ncbi:hypothetical protein DXG03_001650 [Asterophora parasitica]|uniref:Uncharacterized protein n=1 Tax=Asterophora parasitica TaxID=117018 RepID=A0A9P7G6H4_9AGAR|nr:hypothetical protein DXG03_001650 [Asterophora parasitica]
MNADDDLEQKGAGREEAQAINEGTSQTMECEANRTSGRELYLLSKAQPFHPNLAKLTDTLFFKISERLDESLVVFRHQPPTRTLSGDVRDKWLGLGLLYPVHRAPFPPRLWEIAYDVLDQRLADRGPEVVRDCDVHCPSNHFEPPIAPGASEERSNIVRKTRLEKCCWLTYCLCAAARLTSMTRSKTTVAFSLMWSFQYSDSSIDAWGKAARMRGASTPAGSLYSPLTENCSAREPCNAKGGVKSRD